MDIATLGMRIENGQVIKATASLDGMAVAGGKAEAATQRLSRRMALAEISAREMDAAMVKTSRTAQLMTSAFAAFSAIAVVGFIGRETIKNTIEAQNAMAQLEAAVTSTGGAAGRTVAELDALSMSLQKQTTYSDEAVKGAEAMLLTFDKIRGTEFDRATKAVTDLAARMGGDLQGAAVQVGKALQDPATGLTALRRSGVSFSESQVAVIKSLYETGQVAEGQRVILEELEHQFGGSAAAARDTLGGALAGLKNTFGDLFEVTKGGSQGTVDAINAITKALEDSGLSMNSFITNTVVGWNNITAAVQKAKNWMSVDLSNGLSLATDIVSVLNAQVEKERLAANARATSPGKVGPAVGGVTAAGSDPSADARRAAERAVQEAKRHAEEIARAEERAEHERIDAENRYFREINEIWDRGMSDIVASTDRGFRAVLESVNDFISKMIARMQKEGQSSMGLEMAQMALGGGLAGAAAGLFIGGKTRSGVLGAMGGAAGGAGAGFMAGGPIGAAVGGLTGFIGGIIGSGNAAKEAAKQFEALQVSFKLNFEAMNALINNDSIGVAVAQAKAYFEEQRRMLDDIWGHTLEGFTTPEFDAARKKAYDDLSDQERRRIAQLKEQGQAIRDTAASMLNLTSSYKVAGAIFAAIDPRQGRAPNGGTLMSPPSSRTESRSGDTTVVLQMDGRTLGQAVLKRFGGRATGDPQGGFIELVSQVQVQ